MSKLSTEGPHNPDEKPAGNEVPADAFSPVMDPDLVPGESPAEDHALDGPDGKPIRGT